MQENTPPLYQREISGPFAAFCNGDGTNEDMESCLGVAELDGGGFAIQGNKPEDAGRELRGTVAEIRAFAAGILNDPRFQV